MSSSLGFQPPLFVKVKVFTLKNNAPCSVLLLRSQESLLQEKGKGGKSKKKTLSSIQSAAIIHVKCWNTLPADPWCVLSWGLSSTLFSACWTKWRLVEAAERLGGDTGIQVLNAKLPVAAKHADTNTLCECVCALKFVNTYHKPQSLSGVSAKMTFEKNQAGIKL